MGYYGRMMYGTGRLKKNGAQQFLYTLTGQVSTDQLETPVGAIPVTRVSEGCVGVGKSDLLN